jgi:flagellar hook protein FlgE
MAAQADRLSTVADNIANANTTGYKRASVEFSTIVLESGGSEYQSGSLATEVRRFVSEAGSFKYTTSVTDLAIKGDGFFVVTNSSGQPSLTRAGSFVMDGNGDLVNAAGYTLMGYSLANGDPNIVANGFAGLVPVNIGSLALQANASTTGVFNLNLPANADDIAATDLPSENTGTAAYTGKTSLIAYDSLGNQVTVDIFAAKVADGQWEITAFNHADAGPGGGFPYGADKLATTTLTFDPTTGQLQTDPASFDIPVPGGATLTLDMSGTSQLAASYTVLSASVNGNAPSAVERVEISDEGYLYAIFEDGTRVPTYRIPLAKVPSPDNLRSLVGNVFSTGENSGDIQIGFPGDPGFGTVVSSALEQSTVDIASELTAMIEAQRNYTVNSKVFQTGAELMDVLVNLKR